MRHDLTESPRVFRAGSEEIHDYGSLELEPGEMVSLANPAGGECDLTSRDWGFYLGSSLNDRLVREGFKTALVVNEEGKLFVNAVEREELEGFERYLKENESEVICWLDEFDADSLGSRSDVSLDIV